MLRVSTIGLLGRARASLADELDAKAALPRNLDARIFGYFDELASMRGKSGSGGSGGGSGEPGEPPPEQT